MVIARVLTVSLVAAAGLAATAAPAAGAGGQIVYLRGGAVVAEPPDGGSRRVLAREDFDYNLEGVAANRSGRRIVYSQWGIIGGGPGPGTLFTKLKMARRGDPNGRLIRRFKSSFYGFDLSDDGSRIVLAKGAGRTSDNVEIFVIRTNGGGLHRVTHCRVECTDPQFSPNGRRIAFVKGDHVAVMRSRGGRSRLLTRGGGSEMMPTFSPGGNRIAYVSSQGGTLFRIWIMRANGSGERRLTGGRRIQQFSPDFSPTGRAITFQADAFTGSRGEGIFTMRPNGTRKKRVDAQGSDPDWTRTT